MGMSSSQARLLTLTARLHDVELKAQNVMAQKLALATQRDELYQDYCDALDATSFKVAYKNDSYKTNYIDANFKSMCTYVGNERSQQYALVNNKSKKLIVSREVEQMYNDMFPNDKYAFAYAMLGYDDEVWNNGAQWVGLNTDPYDVDNNSRYMADFEKNIYDTYAVDNGDEILQDKYNKIENAEGDAKKAALNEFREYLYDNYSEELFASLTNGDDCNEWSDKLDEFNYYVNLWDAITNAGGCEAIDATHESGEDGTNWLKAMVECGRISILIWDEKDSANKEWRETSFATSYNNNYLQEVEDDSKVKLAETKYEYELDKLDDKDTEFDNELNKLETERKTITTELDSIGKIKDENIDRTFGIFS